MAIMVEGQTVMTGVNVAGNVKRIPTVIPIQRKKTQHKTMNLNKQIQCIEDQDF